MSDEHVDDVGEIDPKHRVGELRYDKNGDAICKKFACDENGDIIDEAGFLEYSRSLSESDTRLVIFRHRLCNYGNALKIYVDFETVIVIPFNNLIIYKCSSTKTDKLLGKCDNCHGDTYLPISRFYEGSNYVSGDDDAVLMYCEHCCSIVEDHLFPVDIKEPAC